MTDETPDPADPGDEVDPVEPEAAEPDEVEPEAAEAEVDPGEVLFYEPGGSRWVVLIGPVLVLAVLIMEIAGPGQVHWPVLVIFLVILFGFSLVQVSAARRHVSVELTETTLRQGAVTTPLADIEKIYPPNNSATPEDWESARALGELHGVPRRRKGVGVRLTSGDLAQAWARDVEVFRSELTQAHAAVRMGLPPSAKKPSIGKDESRKADPEDPVEGQDTTE
ncbi:DUF3093 domain-containing protein [Gordonia sp. GN26]